MAKYGKENSDIRQAARRLEAALARSVMPGFGITVIYLQIAILVSSAAGLLRKKRPWYAGMAMGVGELVYSADAFLLFK
ncbi:MAG: DUF4337 family protein [Betaproteobacteria bacterium]|nr:DUF4337 family protein [Betaproteobacteria bacterium]